MSSMGFVARIIPANNPAVHSHLGAFYTIGII